ncbi:hypothetical protein ACFS07_17435 [Undibacterium arcticum]
MESAEVRRVYMGIEV